MGCCLGLFLFCFLGFFCCFFVLIFLCRFFVGLLLFGFFLCFIVWCCFVCLLVFCCCFCLFVCCCFFVGCFLGGHIYLSRRRYNCYSLIDRQTDRPTLC